MKLYHGTSARYIDAILKNGILTRDVMGTKSNWDKFQSRTDMIYLSTAYPLYFAVSAMAEGELDAVIFEIDTRRLDRSKFFPDEDFVAQVIAQKENKPIGAIHEGIKANLEQYRHAWISSVLHLGNCAHQGSIPVEAITRYAKFETQKRGELFFSMIDPTISIINFQILGAYYCNFVKWVMGDRKILPHYVRAANETKMFSAAAKFAKNGVEQPGQGAELNGFDTVEHSKKCMEFWKKESKDRTGIEVVDLRKKRVLA
jgi:hypothetical protein